MKTLRIPFTILCVLAISALSAHAAQLATVKVLSVEGTVTKYTASGDQSLLKAGDILSQGDSISASELSKADLVFSNGSEITVSEGTSVKIAMLEQEPYDGSQTYEQLQADPSKSQTLLELNYGQLNGHVKKLSTASSFRVKTALGTAAIRGTRFSIGIEFSSNQLRLTINNIDGLVDLITQTEDLGDSAVGEKTFNGEADITSTPIPPTGKVSVSASPENPVFTQILSAIATAPGVDVEVNTDGSITITVDVPPATDQGDGPLPPPVITPEDPDIIVVSPEDQAPN